MRYRRLCVFIGDRHFFAILRASANRRVDRTAVFPQMPRNDGAVFAQKCMRGDLLGKRAVGEIIFCYD